MDYAIDAPGNYGGDAEERRVWPELKSLFPHYETLWRNVIVRLTERPASMSLRTDLSEEWMRLAEDHYSIFLHLAAANNRAKRCYEELLAFEEVFAHLGSILDLVEDFFFTADWILQGVEPQIAVETPTELAEYLAEWAQSKEGEKYLRRIKDRRRPFPVTFFHERHKKIFLRVVPQHTSLWDMYDALQKEVRKPRNAFTHRALTAKLLLPGDNRVLAPRDPEQHSDWYSVFRLSDQTDIVKRDFCEIGELANNTITQAAATINKLWEALWEDSGAQLVQKLPARPNRYGALKSLVSEDGVFSSTASASGVAVTTSASLIKIWNDGQK